MEQSKRITFEQIYYAYRDGMFTYAQVLTSGNMELAEDILQSAFIDVSRNMGRLEKLNEVQVKVYLLRAVQSWAKKIMKKERAIRQTEDAWTDEVERGLYDPGGDILDQLCTKDRMNAIRSAIQSMSEPIKAVLFPYYILDESLPDIARRLNIPYGTVQKRHQRGTKILIDKLKKGGFTDEH